MPVPTRTKTGPRSQILQNGDAFRTESPSGITVRNSTPFAGEIYLLTITSGKKLKRRLEDLERRAASTSASPEQSHRELASPEASAAGDNHQRMSGGQASIVPHMKRQMSPEPMNDFRQSHDDRGIMFDLQSTRQLSTSPPPMFAYSTYPPAQPMYYPTYSEHDPMQPMPAPYYDDSYQNHYATSLHATLPTMIPSQDAIKRESLFPEDDLLSPFNMTYASMAGMDLNNSQAYSDVGAHVIYPNFLPCHHFA